MGDSGACVDVAADVRAFFVEQLAAAMQDLGVETAEPTKSYLVDMLSGFAESERIPELSVPLAEHLMRATAVQGPERVARLQLLGDIALFLSGFFPESFDRRGVSETYVVEMGGRAYLVVARSRSHASRVFDELGVRFRQLARVLDEVRERTSLATDGEILRLYDRFCRHRSPQVERRLRRLGVVPPSKLGLPN